VAPWLQTELEQGLAELPAVTMPQDARPPLAQWAAWLGRPAHASVSPLRLILVWDNLSGHLNPACVIWRYAHGVLPLYTPLSGSWRNLAESLQRSVGQRALAGQHPQTPQPIISRLEETAVGWNAQPTPFPWHGKRYERRQRARVRRHQRLAGSGAACFAPSLIAR
jgi:hypothetical protein